MIRPRQSSSVSTALTVASMLPVWPTMSAFAKLQMTTWCRREREVGDEVVGDPRRAHLGHQVVGRDLLRGNEDAILARVGLFAAAVEEVRHVRVLLGLGQAEIGPAVRGEHVRQVVAERLRREHDRQVERPVVHRHRRRVEPGAAGSREPVELVVTERERARDLPGAIGAEVEDDHRIAVAHRADRRAVGVDDDDRLDELVGDARRRTRPGSPRLPTALSLVVARRDRASGSRRRPASSAPTACRDPSRSSGPRPSRSGRRRRGASRPRARPRTGFAPVGDVSRPSVITWTKTCGTLRRAAISMSACR